MNKVLRYSFVALMAMMGLSMSAQGTTIDFDNDYATLFPTLAGTSSGSSHDGDFTEATTSTAVNGYTVTVSAAAEGVNNANRIWSSAPRLRMYSGTFTVKGTGIKKIEFTGHDTNFNLSTETGTLEGKVWTGEADEVVFAVAKNTQINKIVINGDESEEPIVDDSKTGTAAAPLTVAEALAAVSAMEAGVTSTEDYYIKGKVSSVKYTFSANYGTATFNISDDGTANNEFTAYSVYYLENKAWVDGNTQIAEGDEVILCGKVLNYKGNTPETASKQAYIYSLNGKTKEETTPEIPEVTEITVAQALDIINALEDGKTTAEKYQVKGFIVGTPDFQRNGSGVLYGNVNFDMADEKGGTTTLTVFRGKSFENASFTEETISLLKEGDEVVYEGKLQKYVKNGEVTPEMTGGILISVNGATTNISGVKTAMQQNGAIYNMAGQMVTPSYKGLVIKNGRKYIQK